MHKHLPPTFRVPRVRTARAASGTAAIRVDCRSTTRKVYPIILENLLFSSSVVGRDLMKLIHVKSLDERWQLAVLCGL